MKSQDLATLKYAPALTPTALFRLVVLEGPDAGKVMDVPVSESRVLLGTGGACSLRLGDPHVSRRHLALGAAADRMDLYDLGSSNGTWVNGVRVVECSVRGGETVRIGASTLRVDALGARAEEDAYSLPTFGRAVGPSRVMRRIFAACVRLAASPIPVLLEGETGSGKELLAECIHEAGPRRERPFVVFDPSLSAPHRLAATLFGSEGSAEGPPGAGLFEQAHGGTLLIDGPLDLPLDLQRKLLRAVERGELQRVGSDRVTRVDVRVVTTTIADLDKAVDEGRLREDLFYRLAGARLEVPPLRRRRDDIGPLTQHFWRALAGGAAGAGGAPPGLVSRFEAMPWPGNVRELQNAVAAELVTGDLSSGSDAPDGPEATDAFQQVLAQELPLPQAKQRIVAAFEASYVERLLSKHGGNVSRAAAASGIAHRYFQLLKARHQK